MLLFRKVLFKRTEKKADSLGLKIIYVFTLIQFHFNSIDYLTLYGQKLANA